MSCTFWIRRKRRAAMQRQQEAQKVEVKAEPAEKKPVKKAVKADDPKAD